MPGWMSKEIKDFPISLKSLKNFSNMSKEILDIIGLVYDDYSILTNDRHDILTKKNVSI